MQPLKCTPWCHFVNSLSPLPHLLTPSHRNTLSHVPVVAAVLLRHNSLLGRKLPGRGITRAMPYLGEFGEFPGNSLVTPWYFYCGEVFHPRPPAGSPYQKLPNCRLYSVTLPKVGLYRLKMIHLAIH